AAPRYSALQSRLAVSVSSRIIASAPAASSFAPASPDHRATSSRSGSSGSLMVASTTLRLTNAVYHEARRIWLLDMRDRSFRTRPHSVSAQSKAAWCVSAVRSGVGAQNDQASSVTADSSSRPFLSGWLCPATDGLGSRGASHFAELGHRA